MKRCLALLGALLVAGTALPQSAPLTIKELLDGSRFKPTMALDAVPSTYRAVKLETGAGGAGAMFSNPMMWIGAMFGGMAGASGDTGMLGMMMLGDVAFTTGETARLAGQEFLVTYTLGLDLSDMVRMSEREAAAGEEPEPPTFPLKLRLVRLDSITSVTPMPDFTPAMLARITAEAMAEAKPKTAPDAEAYKQIGVALSMYMADHENRFPIQPRQEAVQGELNPYLLNAEVWAKVGPGLLYNMNLVGNSVLEFPEIQEVVVFYEALAREDGHRWVIFADGTPELVSAERWEELKEQVPE